MSNTWAVHRTNNKEQIMSDEPNVARKSFGHIAPALAEITDKVLFGEVWERGATP